MEKSAYHYGPSQPPPCAVPHRHGFDVEAGVVLLVLCDSIDVEFLKLQLVDGLRLVGDVIHVVVRVCLADLFEGFQVLLPASLVPDDGFHVFQGEVLLGVLAGWLVVGADKYAGCLGLPSSVFRCLDD